jgi:hypothetical protein
MQILTTGRLKTPFFVLMDTTRTRLSLPGCSVMILVWIVLRQLLGVLLLWLSIRRLINTPWSWCGDLLPAARAQRNRHRHLKMDSRWLHGRLTGLPSAVQLVWVSRKHLMQFRVMFLTMSLALSCQYVWRTIDSNACWPT